MQNPATKIASAAKAAECPNCPIAPTANTATKYNSASARNEKRSMILPSARVPITPPTCSIDPIAAGQLTLRREAIDLVTLVHEVVATFSEQIEQSGCDVDLYAPDAIVGQWDRARIGQVGVPLTFLAQVWSAALIAAAAARGVSFAVGAPGPIAAAIFELGVYGLIFFGMGMAMRLPEADTLLGLLRRRLGSK